MFLVHWHQSRLPCVWSVRRSDGLLELCFSLYFRISRLGLLFTEMQCYDEPQALNSDFPCIISYEFFCVCMTDILNTFIAFTSPSF